MVGPGGTEGYGRPARSNEPDDGPIADGGPVEEPLRPQLAGGAPPRFVPPRWLTRRRARLLTGAGTVGLLALALAVVLGTVPGVAEHARYAVFGPTPTATTPLFPGDDFFYIAPGPSWARVTLDGRHLTSLPAFGTSPPLRLARGAHTLTWHAPPFPDQRCTISVPVRGTPYDTCTVDRVSIATSGTGQGHVSTVNPWLVELFPNLRGLAQQYQADLVHAIETAVGTLTSSTTVQPGEDYAGQDGVQRAQVRLLATLNLTFDSDADAQAACIFSLQGYCGYLGQDCRSLCTVPEFDQAPIDASPVWTVLAGAQEYWQYSAADGSVVDTSSSQGFGPTDVPVMLTISWDGADWHVATSFTSPTYAFVDITTPDQPAVYAPGCWPLEGNVGPNGLLDPIGLPTDVRYAQLDWTFAPGPVPAAGCAASATPSGAEAPPAYLLNRFGVLLAANPVAQELWSLPLAAPEEERLASRWLAAAPPPAT